MCIRDRSYSNGANDNFKGVATLYGSNTATYRFSLQWTSVFTFLGAALSCLLYTSDAADERSSVDLGGRRIIKKKKTRRQNNKKKKERKKQKKKTPYTKSELMQKIYSSIHTPPHGNSPHRHSPN